MEKTNSKIKNNKESLEIEIIIISIVLTLFYHFVIIFVHQKTYSLECVNQQQPLRNLYSDGFVFDFYVYVSENDKNPNFDQTNELIWTEKNLIYNTQQLNDLILEYDTEISISQNIQNNGSIYLHLYLVKSGCCSPESTNDDSYSNIFRLHKTKRLNLFRQTSKDENFRSYYHPNLSIDMIKTPNHFNFFGQMKEYVICEFITQAYYPIIFFNDKHNLLKDYQLINGSVNSLTLKLIFRTIDVQKFERYIFQRENSQLNRLRTHFEESLLGINSLIETEQDKQYLTEKLIANDYESNDEPIHRTILIVSLSLILFFLKFYAGFYELYFWTYIESLDNLSIQIIYFNLVESVAKRSIVASITELVKLRIIYVVKKKNKSYAESSTKKYDDLAIKYFIILILLPLLILYSFNNLYNQQNWFYDLPIVIYNFFWFFGCIKMIPQLIINFKLKSINNQPIRTIFVRFLCVLISQIGFLIGVHQYDLIDYTIRKYPELILSCGLTYFVNLIYLYQYYRYNRIDRIDRIETIKQKTF